MATASSERDMARSVYNAMMSNHIDQQRSVRSRDEPRREGDYIPTYRMGVDDSVMDAYEVTMKCYLGYSATTNSHNKVLIELRESAENDWVENLYAFVMPGGHGKTYLAKKYGFIDVDMMVSKDKEKLLYSMRKRMAKSNTTEWSSHNKKWYDVLWDTMSMMSFFEPTVILVHSEECAYSLGARVLGSLVLHENVFEKNIVHRGNIGRVFSRISRNFVIHRSLGQVEMFNSNLALESRVVQLCNLAGIPIPAPYAFDRKTRNIWYAEDVPGWLLRGEVHGRRREVDRVLQLFHQRKIPKQCVDYFVNEVVPGGRAYGFGVTMNDWAGVLANITGAIVRPGREWDVDGDLFDIFPPASLAERHRVNVTLRRLRENTDAFSDPEAYKIGKYHVGERHVFVTGLISHWIGIGRHLEVREQLFPMYLVPESRWVELVSDFHAYIRVSNWFCTTPISEEDRQSMMYMNMLMGRQMYDADWQKVLDERKDDSGTDYVSYDPYRRIWSRGQYLEDFNESLMEAYMLMFSEPRPVDVENFVQFWKKRRLWVAKGSTVLNKLPKEMLNYGIIFQGLGDDEFMKMEMRHNKKSLFESHHVLEMLDETAETWNATKVVPKLNETGKKRELLPGTLMHYLVFSYVLYVAERQQRIGSTRLNVNDDDNIMYYDRKMCENLHHLLYDWADFNTQHSKEDMFRVIDELKRLPSGPIDYPAYCEAISESFYNMYLIGDDGSKSKLEKGLFSGWRGTTWINTVLNYVYVSIAIKCCERLHFDFCPEYVDHGGDDLDIAFRNPEDTFRMLEVMDAIGYQGKAIKQMIDMKAEFYRNTITTRGVFASPTRALANFVSGNWESGGAKTLTEKTTSILDQVGKLERRGVDEEFCNQLKIIALKHWLKIKVDDEWFEVKDEVVHGHPEDGGLGVPDKYGRLWRLEPKLVVTSEMGFNFRLPGAYCSQDYVEMMELEVEQMGLQLQGKRSLIQKLAKQSYDLAAFEERAVFAELNKIEVKVVAYEDAVEQKWDEKIFRDFIDWVNINDEYLNLGRLGAYEELLGHMMDGERVVTKEDLVMLCLGEAVSTEVLEFKGNVYYRRLVPDFLANLIDDYVRAAGNRLGAGKEEMEEWFKTLCYMSSKVYEHRA